MRAHRQNIRVKGRGSCSIAVEYRAVGQKQGQGGCEAVGGYHDAPNLPAPVLDRPIAREVAAVLAGNPIRFPKVWFEGGER